MIGRSHVDSERPAPALVIVRRDAIDRFQLLRAALAAAAVEVIWDRRAADRRRPNQAMEVDRRRQERRARPDEDFLFGRARDRRAGERRLRNDPWMVERRRAERRRGLPSVTCTALDCVVVGGGPVHQVDSPIARRPAAPARSPA